MEETNPTAPRRPRRSFDIAYKSPRALQQGAGRRCPAPPPAPSAPPFFSPLSRPDQPTRKGQMLPT